MIDPLDIDLFGDKEDKEEYRKDRDNFIQNEMAAEGLTRAQADKEWDKKYPHGFVSWMAKNSKRQLNTYGQQMVVDKINEIVEFLNKKFEENPLKEALEEGLKT